MIKTVQSVIKSITANPLKSFLTLITVGLGVGVVIFTLSISDVFSKIIQNELKKEGMLITVANATFSEDGRIEMVRPPQMDANVITILQNEVSGVQAVSPLTQPFWNEFIVNQKTYRIRTTAGVNEMYAQLTGMKMISGQFFIRNDVEKGNKNAVISESLATSLFGSPEAAMNQLIKPPAFEMGQGGPGDNQRQRRRMTFPSFTVTGIFSDFSELKRKAYNLPDFIIPYTSMFPAEMNRAMANRFLSGLTLMSIKGYDLKTIDAQVRTILTREYGDDVAVQVWEGTPRGEDNVLEETRQSINMFSVVVNLLGFLLLVTGSIGILSIMLVEVLGRSRDIALERALGASKLIIIKEYFLRSLFITSTSIVLGILLAFIFSQPLKELILPIFSTLEELNTSTQGIITPFALLTGVVSALAIGGIFGVLPVFSALNTVISQGLREV